MFGVGIAPADFAVNRELYIYTPFNYDNLKRRITRIKTLDGRTYSIDNGYSITDSKITITFKPKNKEELGKAFFMLEYISHIIVSTADGVFKCKIDSIQDNKDGSFTFILYIDENLGAQV